MYDARVRWACDLFFLNLLAGCIVMIVSDAAFAFLVAFVENHSAFYFACLGRGERFFDGLMQARTMPLRERCGSQHIVS